MIWAHGLKHAAEAYCCRAPSGKQMLSSSQVFIVRSGRWIQPRSSSISEVTHDRNTLLQLIRVLQSHTAAILAHTSRARYTPIADC
jgi:hypothetical protein